MQCFQQIFTRAKYYYNLAVHVFFWLGEYWKVLNERSSYVLDSYPIAARDNYRIPRCKTLPGRSLARIYCQQKAFSLWRSGAYLDYRSGQPVEFFLAPGAMSDTAVLSRFNLDVPTGSWLTGDKAYNDYTVEDVLNEAGVELLPICNTNSHHPLPPIFTYL